MKRKVSLLMVLVLLFSVIGNTVFAQGITLNGKAETWDLVTENNRSAIEVKELSKIGLESKLEGDRAILKNAEVTMTFELNSNKVKVNESEFTMDTKSYRRGDKVYIPLRFILETMNYSIEWSREKGMVIQQQESLKFPITLENDGNKYTVSEEPKTIISMAPSVTEILFEIGAGSKVKGRTKYCNYPKEALSVQEIGTMFEPSVEKIVETAPDLVIAETHFKEDVLKKIQEAKIAVVAKKSPNSLQEMYDFVLVIGGIVNRPYEARALASTMKGKVQAVSFLTGPISKKPSVYYVVGTGEYGEFTFGKNTFGNDVIIAAGGKNAGEGAEGYQFSLEKLIEVNPDYIFGAQFALDSMKANENYKALSALGKGAFIVVNEDIFARPSSRIIDMGLKILLEKLHPELIKKLNF